MWFTKFFCPLVLLFSAAKGKRNGKREAKIEKQREREKREKKRQAKKKEKMKKKNPAAFIPNITVDIAGLWYTFPNLH